MKSKMVHTNLNVLDLEKSVKFYKEALGMEEVKRKSAEDGSFTLVFMGDGQTENQLELTWLRDHTEPYNLGDNESHICFKVEDYNTAHDLHKRMGCICYENTKMGLYFIEDPDGYWLEIVR